MEYSSDRKRSTDLMLMLGLSETLDKSAMANSVCLYGHVMRREDGHVLRREDGHVLRLKVKRSKGDRRGHGKNRLGKVWRLV